jgi:YVTN family beta-propeller protein
MSGGLAIADTSTNTVLTKLPLITNSPSGVAVSPDGSRVYVAEYPNVVDVVDTASRKIIAQPQAVIPLMVVASPDGKWVYVSGESSNVSVIDTATNTVSRVVPTGQVASANIGLTTDGKELIVSDEGDAASSIVVIDTTTFAVSQIRIPGLGGCNGVAISPTAPRAYIACGGTTIRIVDTSANTLLGTIQNVLGATFGVVSPDGKTLYVSARYQSAIYVIDLTSNSLRAQISYSGPQGLAVASDGKTLFVTGETDTTVGEIDTTSLGSVGSLNLGTGSIYMALPAGTLALSRFSPKVLFAPRFKAFSFEATFALASTATALTPTTQSMTLTIGGLTLTIPAGSLQQTNPKEDRYTFTGAINCIKLTVSLKARRQGSYRVSVRGEGYDFTEAENPLPVSFTIGNNKGTADVNPEFKEKQREE